MRQSIRTVALVSLVLALVVPAWSADESFVGKWKAEFVTGIGQQRYTFEFKLEDGKLSGKAIGERRMGTNEVKLVEFKTDKDEISFIEPLRLPDRRDPKQTNEVRIEYKGKLKDDEITLHRTAPGIGEIDIVAKRVKKTAPPAKP
jgi:hypothetical protein